MGWNPETDGPYLVVGGLSMVCSLLMVCTVLALRTLQRRVLMRLVFFMAVCDFFFAASFFVPAALGTSGPAADSSGQGSASSDVLCYFQALSAQFFGLASVSWYFCITLNAWSALTTRHASVLALRLRERKYHLFVWGISAATAAGAVASGRLGRQHDGSCWISGTRSPLRALFYLPLFVYMGAAGTLLARVVASRAVLSGGGNAKNRALSRMLAFVLAFFVVWAVPCGVRVYELCTGREPGAGWVVAERVSLASSGLANFCVWITSPAFGGARRRAVAAACCRTPPGGHLLDPLDDESDVSSIGSASYLESDGWASEVGEEAAFAGGGGGGGGGYVPPGSAAYGAAAGSAPVYDTAFVPADGDQGLVDALFSQSPALSGSPGGAHLQVSPTNGSPFQQRYSYYE